MEVPIECFGYCLQGRPCWRTTEADERSSDAKGVGLPICRKTHRFRREYGSRRSRASVQVQLAAKTLLLLPFAAASSAVANEIATGLSDAGVLTEDNAAAADGKAAGTKAKGAMPMAKPQAKAVQQVADTGSDTIEGKLSTLLRKAKEKLFFRMLSCSKAAPMLDPLAFDLVSSWRAAVVPQAQLERKIASISLVNRSMITSKTPVIDHAGVR